MKYNTTYNSLLDLKTTIYAIANIKQKLFNQISQLYNFIVVNPPLFFSEDEELLINIEDLTRSISFDTLYEYRVGTLALSHTNWMRNMVDRLDLKAGEGLTSESTLIWRDLEESPTSSITKHELIFQVKIADEDEVIIVRNLSKKIYKIIYQLASEIEQTYNIANIYNSEAEFITAQMLEHELPNETPKNRELEFAIQKESYILESAGMKLFSGKHHSNIPPFLYDIKNCFQIILKDRVNYFPLKVATIAILASGSTLKDQLMLNNYEKLLLTNFYNDLTKKQYKIIEIKINLPRLMMGLLAKGHIAEVQAGIISNEVTQIKDKFDLEAI